MLDIAANQQPQLTLTSRRAIGIKRLSGPAASRQSVASKTVHLGTTSSLSASKSRLAASPAGIISNGASSESRSKSSSITRVPPAKSRLKQPVASLCSSPLSPTISNGRSSTTSESNSSGSHESHSPRQSAPTSTAPLQVIKKTSISQSGQSSQTTDKDATQRPRNSIASTAGSRSRLIAPTTRTTTSVLPRLVKKPQSSNNEISASSSSSLSTRQSSLTSTTITTKSARLSSLHKQQVVASKAPVTRVPTSHAAATKVTTAASSSKQAIKSNHAAPCDDGAVPKVLPCGRPTSGGSENCLGGRLNNLVAVVHPQQQREQNDVELLAAGQAKQLLGKQQGQMCTSNTLTTTSTSINSPVQQQQRRQDSKDVVRAGRERLEGGIVNLNHKDVNGATAGQEEEITATTISTRRNENDGRSSSVNDLENHRENEEAPPAPTRGKEEARSTVAAIRGDHEVENTSCESKQDGNAAKSDTAAASIEQQLMGITTSGQDRALSSTSTSSSSPADNSHNKTRAHSHPQTSDHAVSNSSALTSAPSSSLSSAQSAASCSSLSGNKFTCANSLSLGSTADALGDDSQRPIASDKFLTTTGGGEPSSRNHDGSHRDHNGVGHEQQQTNMCSRSHINLPLSFSSGVGGMPSKLAVASNVGDCYKSDSDHNQQQQQQGDINLQRQRAPSSALKPTGEPASHLSYMKSGNKNDRHHTTKPPPLPQSSSSSPLKVSCTSSALTLDHDHSRHHGSINDRLLRKPMGQQVLSLMMLDAGLLPATSNQQTTPGEESKPSHVCLQSEPVKVSERRLEFLSSSPSDGRDCNGDAYDGNNNDNYLACDNNETTAFKSNARSLAFTATITADGGFESLADCVARSNLTSSNRQAMYEERLKQIRSPAARTVNHDFSCTTKTSISLPGSPRLDRASRLAARPRGRAAIESSQHKLECALQDKLYHLDNMASHPLNGSSGSYQHATARWLSAVAAGGSQSPRRYGSPAARSSPGTAAAAAATNLYCDTANQTLETHSSLASCSSCSSLTNNHCPPVLALSNQLDAREFHEMIRANVDESVRRMKQAQQQPNGLGVHTLPNESRDDSADQFTWNSAATKKLEPDTQMDLALGGKPWGPPHGDRKRRQQTNLSSKIDRLNEPADRAAGLASSEQQDRSASGSNCESEQQKSRSNNIDVHNEEAAQPSGGGCALPACSSAVAEAQHFELQSRRQQQPRSNSIGGQEFHHFNGAEHHHQQRLKQSLLGPSHLQQNPYIDPSQYYNRRQQLAFGTSNLTTSQQYQTTGLPADPRSISPSYSLAGGGCGKPTDIYVPKRSASIKYPLDRQHRNNLHASLECLNTTYSEYGQSPNQKQQHLTAAYHLARQQQYAAHQQMQQQHPSFQQPPPMQNPHYAATSYVMAAAPAETVVNQNGGQDLAAADMGAPPTQQQHQHYPVISSASNGINTQPQQHNSTSYQIQNLFNSRPSLQMSQSPLHRRMGVGAQANQMAGQNTSSNPMRAGHSSLSLASSAYLIEDKLQSEIKQLASELKSEKEKNEALNNQLTINSSLMAAFEQSLTTLNNRLRQMTAINERKDQEIEELHSQLGNRPNCLTVDRPNSTSEKSTSPICDMGLSSRLTGEREHDDTLLQVGSNNDDEPDHHTSRRQSPAMTSSPVNCDQDEKSEMNPMKVIEDLKRQLVVKERLLTETRLEALSAASKLEELESRLNGEHSLLVNEDDLDEGVMVANHSPSDSDAITDSAHFSEMNSHVSKSSNSNNNNNNNNNYHFQQQQQQTNNNNSKPHSQRNSNNLEDMILFTPTHSIHSNANNSDNYQAANNNTSSRLSGNSTDNTNEMIHLHRQLQRQHDNQSNHSSSDYHVEEDKSPGDTSTVNQQQQQRESHSRDQQQEASRDCDTINKLLSGLLVDN